jgi:hypothetical protein
MAAETYTNLQRFTMRLGALIYDARHELTRREYLALVDTLTALAARLNAEQLEHEERP